MHKVYTVLLFFCFTFYLSSSALTDSAQNDEWHHRLFITGEAQAFIPLDGELETGVLGGGHIGYWWSDWTAIFVQAGFVSIDHEDNLFELDIIPVTLNFRVDLPFEFSIPFHAYLYGGGGILINDSDTAEVDNSAAGQVGGGLEYYLSENFTLNLDMRYLYSDPDIQLAGSTTAEDIDLQSFIVGVGLLLEF